MPPQANGLLCGGGLLRLRGEDLPHQGGKGHIQRGVHVTGQRDAVILQDLDHRGGVVGDDDASLCHAQQPRFALRHAEGARGIHR